MNEFSKFSPDGGTTKYDVKDASARSSITSISSELNTVKETANSAVQSVKIGDNEYKQNTTVELPVVDIQPNCGYHNCIYRGKNLGTSVTSEQWESISNGTFDDMFIGDYWVINGVTWRIAHFDYWIGTGNFEFTEHHVVIVPDQNLYDAQMNPTDTTSGAYHGSAMRGDTGYPDDGNIFNAYTTIVNSFGSQHVLSHKNMFANSVNADSPTNWSWYGSTVEIMSETMVYGHRAWGQSNANGYDVGVDKTQLALFRLDPSKITNRSSWWLRDVYSSSHFSCVGRYGYTNSEGASVSLGVRPSFAIG